MERKIIHIDLDAFFCAVEELRDPTLRGKPFAVGGRPEARGVVASCSYAARLCGVRSAMPMARALRLCPQLIVLPGRYKAYSQASQQVMERLRALTPLVEQVSIDEAFLDVSDLPESGEALARRLQDTIRRELGLPCSLGIATNKLVAKIATDVGKAAASKGEPPNAIQSVPPGQEAAFLAPLPAEALWGVGPKTAARLAELGIHTIGEIARWPREDLVERFGKLGREISERARGLDDRPLVTSHAAKSISQETTFARDVRDADQLARTLLELSQGVARRLEKSNLSGTTVKLKLRWADFTTLTRQVTLAQPTGEAEVIYEQARHLLAETWQPGTPVRLIGVGVTGLGPPIRQLSLWGAAPDERLDKKEQRLQAAVEALRQRFGEQAIHWGSPAEDANLPS